MQYTVKSMLDVLDFCLKMNNVAGQRRMLARIQHGITKVHTSLEEYLGESRRLEPQSKEMQFVMFGQRRSRRCRRTFRTA